jgi:CRISPR-associated protein Cmr6
MPRPLYTMTCDVSALPDGHAGLWYDKFCDAWVVKNRCWSMTAEPRGPNPKLAWIQTVAHPVGQRDLLVEATRRQVLLASAYGGRFGAFATEGRFVTGTGRSHPVENGFAWHPTLGTPYLPGSSIKGMIRRWAEDAGESPARITAAFGAGHPDAADDEPGLREDDVTGRGAGRIVVLDAIPVTPPRLEADVLTPHHAPWTPADPPADWRSPVPVPFLVTARDSHFLFAIVRASAGAAGETDAHANLVEDVWRWLTAALTEQGAGAKTAVGYGRFARADRTTEQLKQDLDKRRADARRAADMATPEGRWRVKLEGKAESAVAEAVRVQLKEGALREPSDRRHFARAVLASAFASAWRIGKPATLGLRPGVMPGGDKLKDLHRLLVAAAESSEDKP